MVIDEDNGKLVGKVNGIQGAYGTALAEASGHAFATDGARRGTHDPMVVVER
jgi:hypothetical protein